MSGIYIHIPFCKQACSYCNFYFVTREQLQPAFVDRLCKEIDETDPIYRDEPVETIYLGGGTPSRLPADEIGRILDRLDRVFDLDLQEVTMEVNPDDVTADYLKELKSLGVGRLSMGVQTFDPERLKFMNRAHTTKEAVNCLELLARTGFDIWTADLIYGLPGQSLKELEKDVRRLLSFDPPHISAYSLTIEPRTRLGKMLELGRLKPADEDHVSEQFDLIGVLLESAGIHRYEVSNYARPGCEAVHNTRYWEHYNYLGYGPSAHSFWWEDSKAVRWRVAANLKSYLSGGGSGPGEGGQNIAKRPDAGQIGMGSLEIDREVLPLNVLAEERLMLGLRTVRGVRIDTLEDLYGYGLNKGQLTWLAKSREEGFFDKDEELLKLTSKGLRIADHLTVGLLSARSKRTVSG